MQNPPIYNYSNQDEEWDKYGSYKPVLHITIRQLRVTLQRFQNDVNEVDMQILEKILYKMQILAELFKKKKCKQ
uniref:Uncharacterized protein n=1 Tax=Onchocerca volvulus TaxID=6282 RepID=A0A8R1TPA7_ONCVO